MHRGSPQFKVRVDDGDQGIIFDGASVIPLSLEHFDHVVVKTRATAMRKPLSSMERALFRFSRSASTMSSTRHEPKELLRLLAGVAATAAAEMLQQRRRTVPRRRARRRWTARGMMSEKRPPRRYNRMLRCLSVMILPLSICPAHSFSGHSNDDSD